MIYNPLDPFGNLSHRIAEIGSADAAASRRIQTADALKVLAVGANTERIEIVNQSESDALINYAELRNAIDVLLVNALAALQDKNVAGALRDAHTRAEGGAK